ALDLAVHPELRRRPAEPAPGRLAGARVVVLDPLRDGLQVVVGLALPELSDREHTSTESTWCKSVRRFAVWARRRSSTAEASGLGRLTGRGCAASWRGSEALAGRSNRYRPKWRPRTRSRSSGSTSAATPA